MFVSTDGEYGARVCVLGIVHELQAPYHQTFVDVKADAVREMGYVAVVVAEDEVYVAGPGGAHLSKAVPLGIVTGVNEVANDVKIGLVSLDEGVKTEEVFLRCTVGDSDPIATEVRAFAEVHITEYQGVEFANHEGALG
jgi:hypothetical protein